MGNATLATTAEPKTKITSSLRQHEFLAFSIFGFVVKSLLLIRMPYRPWAINTAWTAGLIALFYCFFRFRFKAAPPLSVICAMFLAVGLDVLGNRLGLYNHEPLIWDIQYDDITHILGSACALVPVIWVFQTTTRRMGFKLPADMVAFICTCITFSLCSWYEILELWDEVIWKHNYRIWDAHDTPKDLQWDLVGIVLAAFIGFAYYRYKDRREAALSTI